MHSVHCLLYLLLLCGLTRSIPTSAPDLPCGPVSIKSLKGSLTSPGYPNRYPPHTSCKWTIDYPDNSTLTMKLVDLDIEEDFKCTMIPFGGINYAQTIGIMHDCCTNNWVTFSSLKVCGSNTSGLEHSFSKKKTSIKFHSSSVFRGGRGFKIDYIVCRDDQFRCNDNSDCIDMSLRCDGDADCNDNSDEWKCLRKKNPHIVLDECSGDNMLPCGGTDTGCFNNSTERCNGIANCPNSGTDEVNCGICGVNMLYCQNGGCFPLYGSCDNTTHCAGGWDEGERGGCGGCDKDHVPCGYHDRCHCFNPRTQRCNGQMDCPSGIDEISCVLGCENKISCASVDGCYTPNERCNGIPQCSDGSDENGCFQPIASKYQCTSGKCINDYLMCNGEDDCGDNSDETNCFPYTLQNSAITVVIMGSVACGLLLAVIGVAIGLKYYTTRNRDSLTSHNTVPRQEDQEPLDDGSMYHLYREPPPSYQEAVMQGASPPMYWHPTRFMSVPTNSDPSVPSAPVAAPRRQRSRPSTTSTHLLPTIPKIQQQLLKPYEEGVCAMSSIHNVIAGDQLYPEDNTGDDSDTTMLELSDSNLAASTDNFASASETSSPSGTSRSNLIVNDANNRRSA